MLAFLCGVAVAMLIVAAFLFLLLVPLGKDLVNEIFREVEEKLIDPLHFKNEVASDLFALYHQRILRLEKLFILLGYEDVLTEMNKLDSLSEENLANTKEKPSKSEGKGLSLVTRDQD